MASFGQGIRPELGAIDYSAYSRGAQQGAASMQRGMEQMGQGLAQGIEQYQVNKKITGDAIGEIEGMAKPGSSVFKWLSDERNESKAAKLFKKLGTSGSLNMNDATTLSGAVRSFVKSEQISQAKAQQDLQNKQAQDELDIKRMNAKAQQDQVKAEMMRSYFANQPKIAADPSLVGSAEWKRTQDVALAQIAAERAAVTQDEAIFKQDRDEERTVKKEAQDKYKFFQAAESRKNDLLRTLSFVQKAKGMASGGAGGRWEGSGFGQLVSEQSQDFASTIDSINANLRLGKMADLKSLSSTGATGFGQQSDKEGEVMESYLGKIKANQPEKTNIAHLNVIENSINQLLSSYDPEAAWSGDAKIPTWNPDTKSFN